MPPCDDVLAGVGLTRRYGAGHNQVCALDGVDVGAATGELTVIAGPSGSGKSTALRLLACVDRPDEGEVLVRGEDVTSWSRRRRRALRRKDFGIVLAQPSDNLLERLDAAGNLRAAARLRGATAVVEAALATVGLDGAERKRRHELSGGEQQRLAFAIACLGDPLVVLADEPTASLDERSAASLVAVMRSLAGSGHAMVVASHDRAVIDAADRLVRIDHGRTVA